MNKYLKSVLFLAILFTAFSAVAFDQTGRKAPDFKLKSLTDNTYVSLAGLKGKVVLVDFWATWCGPCKQSLPHLEQLSKKYKNFTVVAVNVDNDKDKAVKFLKDLNLDLTAVYDSAKKVIESYDVPEMPTSYLVDQYGKIQYVYSGYSEQKMKQLEFVIRGLVDQP